VNTAERTAASGGLAQELFRHPESQWEPVCRALAECADDLRPAEAESVCLPHRGRTCCVRRLVGAFDLLHPLNGYLYYNAFFNTQNKLDRLVHPPLREFRGHDVVLETDPTGAQTEHWFYQGGAVDAAGVPTRCIPIATQGGILGDGCFKQLQAGEFLKGQEYHTCARDIPLMALPPPDKPCVAVVHQLPAQVVSQLNPAVSGLSSLLYSTFLGGSSYDKGNGITVDSAGAFAYITGYSKSDGFPTLNAWQPSRAGEEDAILVQLNPAATGVPSLVYSSYLGGSGENRGLAIARQHGRALPDRADARERPAADQRAAAEPGRRHVRDDHLHRRVHHDVRPGAQHADLPDLPGRE
jgi:Beta-propeller repeat